MRNVATTARATAIGARHRDDPARRTRLTTRARSWPVISRPSARGVASLARQLADDPSGEQHDEPVGEGEQLVEVLGDQQHPAAGVAHPAQLLVDVGVGADVEATSRLGGDERPGLARQRPGEEHLLHVAARQAADRVVRFGPDVEVGDQPAGVLAHPVSLREPAAPEPVEVFEHEVLLDGQVRGRRCRGGPR